MKRVLVIVVTHNGMHWLQRCLDSVYADADLYVWDNDSVDGSADFVTARYPAAKLVRSAENLGFSMPNNEGMKWALSHGYDYAYLLNQDAWLEAGALDKLVAMADAHPDFGLLSPLQMTDGYAGLDRQFAKALKRGGRHVLDQVQPMFGPGPFWGAGPGPASVPPRGLQGISGGPGPGGKVGPGPKEGWTRSKGACVKGIRDVSHGLVLFEPGKGLLKAGAFELPCGYGLEKLGKHTHLYVGEEVPEALRPFGKVFRVMESAPLDKRSLKDIGTRYPKADVTARNIPLTSDALRKKLGVADGGSVHIFGAHVDALSAHYLLICTPA